MQDLDELRKQLDSIDTQIAKLLDERMHITDQVAEYKNAHNLPLTDPGREHYIFQHIKNHISHNVLKETVEDIYRAIFATSKSTRGFIRHTELPFKKIAIIGLGLIGGSIAKALKAKDRTIHLSTIARESTNTQRAIEQGYIDTVYDSWQELIKHVDLIIIASSIEHVEAIAEHIATQIPRTDSEFISQSAHRKLLVIDISSSKALFSQQFEKLTNDFVEFVPTHPMGGSDKTGFDNAKATLFIEKPWVLTPHQKNSSESITKIKQLIRFLGSNDVEMSAANHDEYAAVVSHLVFFISTYLFAYPFEKHREALQIAGSGFESLTRLASGSAKMHEQIYVHNKKPIDDAFEEFIAFLKQEHHKDLHILQWFEKYKKERDTFVKK